MTDLNEIIEELDAEFLNLIEISQEEYEALILEDPTIDVRYRPCVDMNKVYRAKHELDKDDRCVFCNWLRPGG